MKVLKSGDGFTQAGQDELALLRCVSDRLFLFLLTRLTLSVSLSFEFRIKGNINLSPFLLSLVFLLLSL